ncbi:hypothetical protein [Corynebacterium freneyi]|uniref:Uncharacterized protein n=1 Tax=Corynebacterium freneyi DNF00450 TaxID=1287475 RepID=A0A095Y0B4_9CORY|nr:hypothetical protein [Corynebacterium freneyi]KGF15506.1 hypothetical protein HMPREF1650_10885 [Corynebacterium freneyi DNF00450]
MADNNDAQNDGENNGTSAELPPMTLPEIQAALNDESHPRYTEALRIAATTAKNLDPSLQKYRESLDSQINVREIIDEITKPRVFDWAPKVKGPVGGRDVTPYVLPSPPVVEPDTFVDDEWLDGVEEAQRERAERERRQDDTAEASLEALQAVSANLQLLNQKLTDVEKHLDSGNKASGRLGWATLIVAVATLIATVVGIIFF